MYKHCELKSDVKPYQITYKHQLNMVLTCPKTEEKKTKYKLIQNTKPINTDRLNIGTFLRIKTKKKLWLCAGSNVIQKNTCVYTQMEKCVWCVDFATRKNKKRIEIHPKKFYSIKSNFFFFANYLSFDELLNNFDSS